MYFDISNVSPLLTPTSSSLFGTNNLGKNLSSDARTTVSKTRKMLNAYNCTPLNRRPWRKGLSPEGLLKAPVMIHLGYEGGPQPFDHNTTD